MATLQETDVNGTVRYVRQDISTTSSRNLALTDRNKVVACNSASTITITVPADSTVNFPVGSVVYIVRLGSGVVTLAAAGGVTVSRTGNLGSSEELYVRKRAANNWIVVDRPAAPSGAGGSISFAGGGVVHTFTSSGTFTLS
jgi:hypothetical protein